MADLIERGFQRLDQELCGRLSRPGNGRYAATTAIWAKPVGADAARSRALRTAQDVQSAIRAARDCDLPLSVRGGGHDWAGRALCDGIVIDLSGMNDVNVEPGLSRCTDSGGARAANVLAVTDPRGPRGGDGLVQRRRHGGAHAGRRLRAADRPLRPGARQSARRRGRSRGRAHRDRDPANRRGTVLGIARRRRQFRRGDGDAAPTARSAQRPFRHAAIPVRPKPKPFLKAAPRSWRRAPEELTVQLGLVGGPDGVPLVVVVPTWCGRPEQGEARLAPFLGLGTLVAGDLAATAYGASLATFDPFIATGQRVFMETCWLPALDSGRHRRLHSRRWRLRLSPGCAIITHEFRGAASRVPVDATAFGLRRDHVLVEILASFTDRSEPREEQRHQRWAQAALRGFDGIALPGGYPNLLAQG